MRVGRTVLVLFAIGLALAACRQPPKPVSGFGNPDPAVEDPDH
jgi:hypothetical protein